MAYFKFSVILVLLLISLQSAYSADVVVQNGQVIADDEVRSPELCIGTDCRTSWPSGGTSQWTTSGSNIYYNSGNVGIGSSNPAYKLHVNDTIASTNQGSNMLLGCTSSNCWTNANGIIGFSGSGVRHGSIAFYPNSNAIALVDSSAGSPNADYGDLTTSLNFNGLWAGNGYFKGNVGIGVSEPLGRLHIQGGDPELAIVMGSSTTTQYSNLMWLSDAGNAQIWKSGSGSSAWGGFKALNFYTSEGDIAFHPAQNANSLVLDTKGNMIMPGRWTIAKTGQWGGERFELHTSSWGGSSNDNYGGIAAGHIYSYGGLEVGTNSGSDAGPGQIIASGDIKGGRLCIGTDCRSAWPSGSGGTLTGSGTTNRIPLWSGGASLQDSPLEIMTSNNYLLHYGNWIWGDENTIGMYTSAGHHFYADGTLVGTYWLMRSKNGMRIGDLTDTAKGFLYHDENGFGLLSADANWRVRTWNGGQQLYGNTNVDNLCLGSDCRSAWPTVSGAQTLGTSGDTITLSGSGGSVTAPYASSSGFTRSAGNYVSTWDFSTPPSGYNYGIETAFVSAPLGWPSYGTVLSVMGRSLNDPGGNFQIYSGYGGNYGGNYLQYRKWDYDAGAWTPLRTIIDSANIGSQSVSYATSAGSVTGGITTSNIGSQSVSYATSAGTANSVSGGACKLRDSGAGYSWGNCPSGYSYIGGIDTQASGQPNVNVATVDENYWHATRFIWLCCK